VETSRIQNEKFGFERSALWSTHVTLRHFTNNIATHETEIKKHILMKGTL